MSHAAPPSDEYLIIGAGVIGLSLAYQLAGDGHRVHVIDRGEPGKEASWAGAGILAPASVEPHLSSMEQLEGLSFMLHPLWASQLREQTGIDNGFRRCGGIYLAETDEQAESLARSARLARRHRHARAWMPKLPFQTADIRRPQPHRQ